MRRPTGVTLIATVIAVVVLVLLGVALWFQVDVDDAPEDASVEGIELAELLANPEEYDGQTVTVVAPVGAILNPNAFVLGAEQADQGLLVVAHPEDAEPVEGVQEGDIVRATGDVEILTPGVTDEFADLEQDIQFDIPDELSGEPMLVAEVVSLPAEEG